MAAFSAEAIAELSEFSDDLREQSVVVGGEVSDFSFASVSSNLHI